MAEALSTPNQAVQVRERNTGDAITNNPFITISIIATVSPGLPQRRQVDDYTEYVSEDRIATCSVQAYGAGAMTILFRFKAWLGCTQGMQGLSGINISCPASEEPKDISAAVSTGWEERAVMNITLSYTDVYATDQDIIAEVPINVITDNPPTQFDIDIKIKE
jgi:hypothetical protein